MIARIVSEFVKRVYIIVVISVAHAVYTDEIFFVLIDGT